MLKIECIIHNHSKICKNKIVKIHYSVHITQFLSRKVWVFVQNDNRLCPQGKNILPRVKLFFIFLAFFALSRPAFFLSQKNTQDIRHRHQNYAGFYALLFFSCKSVRKKSKQTGAQPPTPGAFKASLLSQKCKSPPQLSTVHCHINTIGNRFIRSNPKCRGGNLPPADKIVKSEE